MFYEYYSWKPENKAMVFMVLGWQPLDPMTLQVPSGAPTTRKVQKYALRLRGIRVRGRVGVSDAERAKAQELVVAVDLELGGRLYPSHDELDRAADYAEIVETTAESASEGADRLLETFALRVAQRLADRWPAAECVRVAVTKAAVPVTPATDAASVEVTLGDAWS